VKLASTCYECSTGDKERQLLRYGECYLNILRYDWCLSVCIAHYQSIRIGVFARGQTCVITGYIDKRNVAGRERATWDIDRDPWGQ